MVVACDDGGRRRDAGGADRHGLLAHLCARAGCAGHQLQDVDRAGDEGGEIHHDEGGERPADSRRRDRRHRLGGAQQVKDGERLPPNLGGHPSRDDGDEPRRTHQNREAMQQRPVIEPAAGARPQAEQPQRQYAEPQPDHQPERPEHHRHRRPVRARHAVEAGERCIPAVLEDERRKLGDLHRIIDAPARLVGPAEQHQRRAMRMRLEVSLHRHHLDGLKCERVQALGVARENLHGGHQRRHPQRHREHRARRGVAAVPQQVPGPHGADRQRGREIGRDHRVHQAVGKARIEDDRQP